MEALITTLGALAIPLHRPGQIEYERVVATENLMFRYARPAAVLQPSNIDHVQTIMRECKPRRRRLTIRNGGHSYSGLSTANGNMLLDLSKMKTVTLDMTAGKETVTLGGGARWGDAYKVLVNGGYNRWVINGGRCSTVGVSGFLLGGGLGPFTRSFGMGCNRIKEMTVVTAAAELVTVRDTDDRDTPEGKLFWALCGAGGGNFGVVAEIKMKLEKLQGKSVVAGMYIWAPKVCDVNEMVDTMNKFYTAKWPRRSTIDGSWVCNLADARSELYVRLPVYHNGNKGDFDGVVEAHIKHPELAKQLKRRCVSETSSWFFHETLVSQWSDETKMALPSADRRYSIYTSFVVQNTKPNVEGMTRVVLNEMKAFRNLFNGEEGQLQVTWIHAGGKAKRKKPKNTTAFAWRDCTYHVYIMLQWREKWLKNDVVGFLRRLERTLRPFSVEQKAANINFPDGRLPDNAYEEA